MSVFCNMKLMVVLMFIWCWCALDQNLLGTTVLDVGQLGQAGIAGMLEERQLVHLLAQLGIDLAEHLERVQANSFWKMLRWRLLHGLIAHHVTHLAGELVQVVGCLAQQLDKGVLVLGYLAEVLALLLDGLDDNILLLVEVLDNLRSAGLLVQALAEAGNLFLELRGGRHGAGYARWCTGTRRAGRASEYAGPHDNGCIILVICGDNVWQC